MFIVHLPQNAFPLMGRFDATVGEFPAEGQEELYRTLVLDELGIAHDLRDDERVIVTVRPTVLKVNGLLIFPPPIDADGAELRL